MDTLDERLERHRCMLGAVTRRSMGQIPVLQKHSPRKPGSNSVNRKFYGITEITYILAII